MIYAHLVLFAQADTSSAGSGSQLGTVVAILASAVIVLGGLTALVRAIWRTATILRDNTVATKDLTTRMDDLTTSVDGRFDRLLHRVETLEHKTRNLQARGEL